jgi:hypothetical protein
MGLWDDIVNGVADVVETAVNAVADVASDVVETAGDAAEDGLDALGGSWPVTQWVGGVVAGITNLVGSVLKGAAGIVGGVVGGLIRVIGGILGWDKKLVIDGWVDIGASIAGSLLLIVGHIVSLVQRIILVQTHERPLTKAERAILTVIFQNSISLYSVRLVQGASGLFGVTTSGAFTMSNTIYLNQTNLKIHPETLVHECVHVWQYQNLGSKYSAGALGAQFRYGRSGGCGDAYDWTLEASRGHAHWKDFNREAQAQLIEEVWTDGTLTSGGSVQTGSGAFYETANCQASFGTDFCVGQFIASDTPDVASDSVLVHCPRDGNDHTDLANEATADLRAGFNLRLSRGL